MSGVELKPCGVSSGDNILVPLGSTTVGRGPFLGISDKRVSRNHAILDIEDGKFRVKPIHVNPTYFSKAGDSKLKPLKKDEWKELENGNRVSLTPNEHIFEVMIDDRPVQSLTQSPRSSIGTASPVKTFKDSPLKSQTEDKDEDAPSPACRKLDFHADNNDSTAEEETNDGQEEMKKSLKNEKEDGEDEEDSSPLGEDEMDVKPSSEDNKIYANPVDRKRELPDWMLNLPSGQEEEPQKAQPKVAKKTKAAPKASSRAKKRPAEEILDEEEEVKPPAKKRGAPARTPRKKTATSYKEDEEEEDEEDEEAPVPELKKRTSSRGRQTTRVSYVDDVEVDDDEGDEEFVAARDEEEEESDWEEASSPKKKGKGKGKSPRGAKGKKRRGRRSYSDEESSEEDVYIPKPTKRTAKILSDSQRSTGSETTNSRRRRNRSDDKENGDETRKPCPYGSKCYRKNPRHNKDFSHPDDDDYNSESEIVEPEEDDKAECPYGLNCYRTNLEHKKQFKHPLSSDRPQRQTRRGRGKAAENGSDEDAPDTYDYEDSFLDDENEEEEDTPQTKASEDSDWDPGSQENSEDVSQLVKEAKGYIKNKKMQKPI